MRNEPSPTAAEQQLRDGMERMRAAQLADGPPSLQRRRQDLERLRNLVLDNEQVFADAIDADFRGRSAAHTRVIEVLPTVLGIKHASRNLRRWMRPQRRRAFWALQPSSATVVPQPLGVVGIISPWNYPLLLSLGAVTSALAAGNRVMLKPSELGPRFAEALADAVGRAFERDKFHVVTGDVEVARTFTRQPWDHLLFTGSGEVGRLVMRAASENLTPVTLELGGKSPVVVEPGARSMDLVADSLTYGKLINGGQTCVAPDYALVQRDHVDAFVEAFQRGVAKSFPTLATNPEYVSIANDRHYERMIALRADALAKGGRIVECNPGGESDEAFEENHRIKPTLILDAHDGMRAMQEEIFGPLLPVVTYGEFGEAIDFINARPRPLAAYLFSSDERKIRWFRSRTTSGALGINVTVVHVGQPDLPFGGVGASGMGAYHAEEGFRTFSHLKAVYRQRTPNLSDVVKPPMDRPMKQRILDLLMHPWT